MRSRDRCRSVVSLVLPYESKKSHRLRCHRHTGHKPWCNAPMGQDRVEWRTDAESGPNPVRIIKRAAA